MATATTLGATLFSTHDEFIDNWLASPQTSMYYSLQVMQNTQAKDDALAALDGNFGEMFGFDDDADDDSSLMYSMTQQPV